MCEQIFSMVEHKDGYRKALEILNSGKAYRKMMEIIKAQGGKGITSNGIKVGRYSFDILSAKSGRVAAIDNILVSRIARIAGATHDKGAGIYLYKHVNDKVKRGEKLFTIYAQSGHGLKYAKDVAKGGKVFTIK